MLLMNRYLSIEAGKLGKEAKTDCQLLPNGNK